MPGWCEKHSEWHDAVSGCLCEANDMKYKKRAPVFRNRIITQIDRLCDKVFQLIPDKKMSGERAYRWAVENLSPEILIGSGKKAIMSSRKRLFIDVWTNGVADA